MRLSASMMNTWMTCSLQAKFHYVDHLPDRPNSKTSFGKCIHYALEIYNQTGDVDKSIGAFRAVWNDPDSIGASFDVWAKMTTFGGLMQRGVELLREYHDKVKWERRKVLSTEHRFLVPFGDHELTGIVDLLEVKKSAKGKPTLRIVDYKTASKAPFVAGLRVNVQFTSYVYASLQREFWVGNGPDFPGFADGQQLYEEHQEMPRRAIWYHCMTNKEYDAGDRDQGDYERLYRAATEINRAAELQVFVPNISGDSCVWCPYTDPCGVTLPKREDVLEEEESWF